jgi:hypothetical protein
LTGAVIILLQVLSFEMGETGLDRRVVRISGLN